MTSDSKHVIVFFRCRTINAMLNCSAGGNIYIGISDDAKVHGLLMNQYKVWSVCYGQYGQATCVACVINFTLSFL